MINRYKVRRALAPTAGLWKSILVALFGLFVFVIGVTLSFQLVIVPAVERLGRIADRILHRIVPLESLETATHIMGGGFLFLGIYLIFLGIRMGWRQMMRTIDPRLAASGFAESYVRRQQLAMGPHIVALGGGTGLSTLLRGLKHHSSNITAIVTVTDDGGSSGRLVQDKGMIPPGDIRNCLVALADAEKAMTDLFQHRFKRESGTLSGHSMGNLLIAALLDQAHGDFEKAIEIASDVLAIRGRVLPATMDHVRLRAVLDDGTEVCGETAIVEAHKRIRRIYLDPANARAHQAVLDAIRDADLICIGPGSVYTSVIPNLLVPGVVEAIRESDAPKAYVCNVMTQPGESDSFTASEHVQAVLMNTHPRVFDYVLVNTGVPSESALEKYREYGQHFVDPDIDRIRSLGFRPISGNFMSESDFVRHDPLRVAERLLSLLGR